MLRMTVEMPIAEQSRFRQWTDNLSAENRTQVRQLIANTAAKTCQRAKMFAVVDHGRLRGGIRWQTTDAGYGARIYTGTIYAPYVEFGTGTKVVAPDDVADYAMTFKGRGIRKVNLPARPYLFPAMRISLKEMYMKLNQMGFKETKE